MKKLRNHLVFLLFSVFSLPAFAQGSFWKLPQPLPNSKVLVCPIQTANPCPSPSSIFSDVALTVPVVNPFNVGPTGNFGFFVASGQYTIYVGQPYNLSFDVTLGGGGGSLPAGLTFVSPTLTVSSAGNGNGALALSGNTSGVATFTAPAVAGTITNPVILSSSLQAAGTLAAGGANTAGASAGDIVANRSPSVGVLFLGGGGGSLLDFGVNTAGQFSFTGGAVNAPGYISRGTTFTASGCANSTLVGGASAGKYTSVTGGTCTVTITMGNSSTAPNGWVCDAHDLTTVADANNVTMGASTTTTANLVEGTVVANDVIAFKCTGY